VPSRKESATRLAVASTSGSERKALITLKSKPPIEALPLPPMLAAAPGSSSGGSAAAAAASKKTM
jgi:Asp-tRNA(Asn)/Glu-tRNA(Gln) amidotransferase A subunit family amidase